MSDLVEQPTVEAAEPFEPFASSADGKRNSFTLTCLPTEQSMNYAACLWRQSVLAKPDINTPPDWAACRTARNAGTCPALQMRQEEELAGKSIYFRARNVLRLAGEALSRWVMPASGPKKTATKVSARPVSMLDAMGKAGDLSDAVSAAAETPRAARAPIPITPAAFAGESPLQMARRLRGTKS